MTAGLPVETEAAPPGEAGRRRPSDGERRARGDPPLEDSGAADLRVGSALVGRLRDRIGARRPRGGLRNGCVSRVPDLDRRCAPARDRRRLLSPNRSRLRDERRRVCRREGESRHVAESRRSRGAPRRLCADGGGLDRRRGLRSHVVRALSQRPQGRAFARLSRSHRLRQPSWRSRVRARLCPADLRIRRRDVRARRRGTGQDHPRRPTAGGRPGPCRGRRSGRGVGVRAASRLLHRARLR